MERTMGVKEPPSRHLLGGASVTKSCLLAVYIFYRLNQIEIDKIILLRTLKIVAKCKYELWTNSKYIFSSYFSYILTLG